MEVIMSVPFTDLDEGSSAQNGQIANEIIQSYNEHLDVLGGPGMWPRIESVGDGTDAQNRTDWNVIQWFIEYNAHEFLDHVNGPYDSGETGTTLLYFTKPSWRTAAGLNAGGFQRSNDGTTMYYSEAQGTGGNIFANDVRGPWCFSDLQKGLSALRYTYKACTAYADASRSATAGNRHEWWRDGWAEIEAVWASAPWVAVPRYYQWYVSLNCGGSYVYWNSVSVTRNRCKYKLTFDASLPFLPARVLDVYLTGSSLGGSGYVYFDYDATGTPPFSKYLSDINAAGAEYISDWIGDIDTCPATLMTKAMWPSYVSFPNFVGTINYVTKWDFTYQND